MPFSLSFAAVIFDIGGVLEITPPTGWERRWAGELGLTVDDLEQRLVPRWTPGETGGKTLELIERETAEVLGLDDGQLRRLMSDIWAEYLGTLNEPLAEYFAGLRPAYRTGILSNSFVGARERERAAYGLEDLCDVIVYSHEVGVSKPDSRAYQLVCDQLGVRPHEALFLDDKQMHVEGAERAGLTALRFATTEQAIADVERHLKR
jgi:epoxide hydrolase-like predicted phosphatase